MEWSDVLDPDIEPSELLCERLPRLHETRLEQFRQFVDTPLIFCVAFSDSDDRFTLRFDGSGAEAVAGEMIDFPQATARGDRAHWARAVRHTALLVDPADDQIERYEGRVTLTEEIKQEFERFDGILAVRVVDLPDGDGPIEFEVILNDYEAPPRARRATLEVSWKTLDDVAHGRIDPVEASRRITVGGAMGLAFDLGGFFLHEFDL